MLENSNSLARVKPHPTQDELRRLFDYHTDGYLIWRKRTRGKLGKINITNRPNTENQPMRAGTKSGRYWYITISRKQYAAHRLIWIWHNGEIPTDRMIDHSCGYDVGDKIEFLRLVSYSMNARNMAKRSNNTSGFGGVSFHRNTGKFVAYFSFSGKRKHIGLFPTIDEARVALIAERAKYGFTERHGT